MEKDFVSDVSCVYLKKKKWKMSFLIFLNSLYIVELLVEDLWHNQQKVYMKNPAKLKSNQWLMQWSYCEIAKM